MFCGYVNSKPFLMFYSQPFQESFGCFRRRQLSHWRLQSDWWTLFFSDALNCLLKVSGHRKYKPQIVKQPLNFCYVKHKVNNLLPRFQRANYVNHLFLFSSLASRLWQQGKNDQCWWINRQTGLKLTQYTGHWLWYTRLPG